MDKIGSSGRLTSLSSKCGALSTPFLTAVTKCLTEPLQDKEADSGSSFQDAVSQHPHLGQCGGRSGWGGAADRKQREGHESSACCLLSAQSRTPVNEVLSPVFRVNLS